MRILFVFFVLVALVSCSDSKGYLSGSLVRVCGDAENNDVCALVHDGAMCGLKRANVLREAVSQKKDNSAINAYKALIALDEYKACLDNAVIVQSARDRNNDASRFEAVRKIPDYQNEIASGVRGVKPEVHLWRYKQSGDNMHWSAMVGDYDKSANMHPDVYTYMISEATSRDIEKAKSIADDFLYKNEKISDLPPELYGFYTTYYLKSGNVYKSAVWQGLYANFVQGGLTIDSGYFERHEVISFRQMEKAQSAVDDIVHRTQWRGLKISDIPRDVI